MIRSYDPEIMRKATEGIVDKDFDFPSWTANEKNVMWDEDGSIGLATYEYPGVYSLHWFYRIRGRAAMDLARRMVDDLFTNYDAHSVRGLTPVKNRAARLAARWLGMKSYGVIMTTDGEHELFCMTKKEFYE